MEEKSQIVVKKKEPIILAQAPISQEPKMITLADKEYVVKSLEQATTSENKEMNQTEQTPKWIMPVEGNYRISSDYGNRIHPVLKEQRFHDGIDIAVPLNTSVRAVADGVVFRLLWNGGYGKYIEIKHSNSLSSFYAHLNSYSVELNDKVIKGQEIAKSGNTAGKAKNGKILTTGPHLHFGAKKNGKSINPLFYVE